jgi:hypothetical protein
VAIESKTLRVVAFKDGDTWVAQCLEHDIATQAVDLDTLRSRMQATIIAEIEAAPGGVDDPLAHLEAAPDYFQVMWDSTSTLVQSDAIGGGPTMELKLAA